MTQYDAAFADSLAVSDAVHAATSTEQVAAFADSLATSDAVHAATSTEQVAAYVDSVTLTDAVEAIRGAAASFWDALDIDDAVTTTVSPPGGESVEEFALGVLAVQSEEPFDIEAAAVVVSVIEPFDILGTFGKDSVEPFDLGANLMVNSVETFSIMSTDEGSFGTGTPASPRLGFWTS